MKNLAILLLVAIPLNAASRMPVRAQNAVVASVDVLASNVGITVMKRGGNAVDAAVAVALALAVTWPEAGNLGGGGFMMIRKADGTLEAIDYRERAPLKASRDMYLDAKGNVIKDASFVGYRAIAVPGTVAGLALAHKRHGKLPWKELVEPAYELANNGFVVSDALARSMAFTKPVERMKQFAESNRIFLRNGKPYQAGEMLLNADLAQTLSRLKDDPMEFYRGETAKRIVSFLRENGGILTMDDFAQYEPTVRTPVRGTYRGYEIVSMPPPSSGGIALIEMLNMLEPYDVKSMGWHSSQHVHTVVEVMRRAYADRAKYLGDTDFAKGVPVATLLSREHALQRRKDIDPAKASKSADVVGGSLRADPPSTTHFGIIDPAGNLVINTYTINESYGSAVTAPGTGFLLNNEMDDFTVRPGVPNQYGLLQGEANAIQPRKRPLSSMTPTIVMKDGKPYFALGSPGGSTIINTVLQVVSNVIDFGMNIQEAIDAPRFHHQWMPDTICWEPFEFSADTWSALEKMGHVFNAKPGPLNATEWPMIGDVHAVMFDKDGTRIGASDVRRGGLPAGW